MNQLVLSRVAVGFLRLLAEEVAAIECIEVEESDCLKIESLEQLLTLYKLFNDHQLSLKPQYCTEVSMIASGPVFTAIS